MKSEMLASVLVLADQRLPLRLRRRDLVGRRIQALQERHLVVEHGAELDLRRLLRVEGHQPPFDLALQRLQVNICAAVEASSSTMPTSSPH
ncbi:MAG: hypothetical protein ABWZ74_07470 [Hyphomicrobiaceae bacterium]|jgi:hypothetical protein